MSAKRDVARLLLFPATALLISAAITGCSSGAGATSPSTRTVSRPATYATVPALKAAFVKAGGDCSDWNPRNGSCGSTHLFIFRNAKTRDTFIALTKSQHKNFPSLDSGNGLLVGQNWVVDTAEPELYKAGLGGTVVSLDDD